ncbi:MAG: DNA polymerase III subunit gamma/tau [Chloroflexota bacterium]|nr:DNA polymerase III subunit gamma/tau [Chloroflexota bacterium]
MASQALYRRYRSQTFDELIGQEHIVQTLRNALAEGRIAHAYLFTGPRGVGKTTVARLLAKAVNCSAAQELRPCGECQSCRAVADGRAVDVIEMDAASHTSVEDAREIIERVQFRPTSGEYKVYIIDEVHMLSTAAFNALLKTLEEPPGHALFILATTENHKVPATILSRCQRFTFNRHTVAATALHLHGIATEEQFALEPGVAESIARAATGSMRDALSVLDQLMAYGSGTITLEQVRGLIGATEAQEVAALVDALIGGDLAGALRAIAGVAAQGADLRQFTRDLVEQLRALMLLKAGGDRELIDVTDDDLAALEQQAAAGELGALLHWVKLFSGLDHQLRTSTYGQLPLELAVVEAIAAPATSTGAGPAGAGRSIGAVQARPAPAAARPVAVQQRPAMPTPPIERPTPVAATLAPPAQLATPPEDVPTVQPAAPPAPFPPAATLVLPTEEAPGTIAAALPVVETTPVEAPVDFAAAPVTATVVSDVDDRIASDNAAAAVLEQVESVWEDVLQGIKARDRTLFVLLTSSGGVKPIDVKDDHIVFEVKNDWQVKRIEQDAPRRVIEVVLSKCMGSNYRISCVAEAQNRENPNVRREQIRDSRKDLHVKAAINIFDADIIDVEHHQ